MTSCLRMVPKFSTPSSRAIWFNSAIDIACNFAMLSEVAAMRSLSLLVVATSSAFSASRVSTGVVGGRNSSLGGSATAVVVPAPSVILPSPSGRPGRTVFVLAFLGGLGIAQ